MAKKQKPEIKLYLADPNSTPVDDLKKTAEESDSPPSLVKSILNVLNGPKDSIERLAFDIDPSRVNQHMSVYRAKQRLIPDTILKRVAIQDDLVASILTARSNQISAFGVQRKDRFSVGFEIKLNKEYDDQLSEEQKNELNERIKKVNALLLTCGKNANWKKDDRLTFSQFLFMITRNGLTCGRFAVEAIYNDDVSSGKKVFHSFRPIDAGTIYKATPQKEAEDRIRQQARHILETVKNKDLSPERFQNDEYAWIQVIEGSIYQAFTDKECLVHNLYPVVDIELDGYPLTPIDTSISAITTHINITTHNKLYFQSGRAARGMMVIKSEDINGEILDKIRAQFNANINNVNNSWRTPIFTVGAQDDVSWMSIDSGGRDMEFQYLSDNNARVILSAFQISPEELPGYAHLSRGTNSQALSESNSEFKLEAHRDLGIRPLIAQIETFLNERIFPLLDETLAKICTISLTGLDSDTPEKESVRLQQDAPLHMTYDAILQAVEKKPIGKEWAGEFPFNAQYQAILDKYFTVGEILEQFFGRQGASKDPKYQYIRDSFWFQNLELQMQMQQAQAQQQQAQMQAQQQAQGQGQEQPQGQGQPQDQQQGQQPPQEEQKSQLGDKAEEAMGALGKSEAQLSTTSKMLAAQQRKTIDNIMRQWESDSRKATQEILKLAEHFTPKK